MGFGFPFESSKRKRLLSAADKKRIAAKQGWKCRRCGRTLPVRYHADHIKEFSDGGSDRESNIQVLCPNCHAEKTETDRHRKKQRLIRKKERTQSGGLVGNTSPSGGTPRSGKLPRKTNSNDPLGLNFVIGAPKKKGRLKKQKGIWDF